MNAARPLVIGNWKMNLDFVEGLHLVQQLGVLLKNRPARAHRRRRRAALRGPAHRELGPRRPSASRVALGAQHVNPHENGAHTGEVSVSMLPAPRRRSGSSSVTPSAAAHYA